MWFFYSNFFLVEIWLTLATSRITHHHHHHPPSGELNCKGFLIAVTFTHSSSSENVFAKCHLMPIRVKIFVFTLSTLYWIHGNEVRNKKNHIIYQICVCGFSFITSKLIELQIRSWNQFLEAEKLFPYLMSFLKIDQTLTKL